MNRKAWQLRQRDGDAFYIIDKSPTILGRDDDCDVVLDDSSVSGKHVQMNLEGKSLTIHDLDSVNGILFNEKPIRTVKLRALGQSCNQLQMGDVLFDVIYGPIQHHAAPQPTVKNEDDIPQWFFVSDGVEHGPLSLNQVDEAVANGTLKSTDDFWQEGMDYRVKAFEVEGLFNKEPQHEEVKQSDTPHHGAATQLCPYCWHKFHPEDVLFIASHSDLLGDPVLGNDEAQRFLPTRFTADGQAIDAGGVICPDMACPVCHLRLPAAVMNQPPLFISIVGAPSSGKSYFLASSVWSLRKTLPKFFKIHFLDVDAVTNQWLNDYEEKLFFQADGEQYQTIAKTDMQAPSLYRQVFINNMRISLPLPSLFSLHGNGHFPKVMHTTPSRTLVLYDNAGEHFQAGGDSASAPGTKHLVHADGILFLFDPTADPRFRPALKHNGGGAVADKMHRQDVLLVEMIGRIRKHLGLRSGEKIEKTVMVGVSKADLLAEQLPLEFDPWKNRADDGVCALDLDIISKMSNAIRTLLCEYAPEIVATVESFSESVLYVPNSALGHNPTKQGVRPSDIKPKWVEVPFLYVLSRLGYVPCEGALENCRG
ncbi:MAG: FHA domain-containing protein [bacterium]